MIFYKLGDNMKLNIEKIKSIVIIVLLCIVFFGGSFLFSELQYYKNNVNSVDEKTSSFVDIDIDRYLSLLNFSKLSFIYIGKDDCEYSNAQDSVLESLINDYNINVYHLNLSKIDSNSVNSLYESYNEFVENGIGTPSLMLVQNGEVKAFKRGYTTYDNLLLFLEENSFIVK